MSSGVRSPVTPLLFELPPRPTLQTEYRHHAVNDIIACTFRSIGVPAVLEPPGLLKGLLFPAVYYYPAVVFTACLRDVTRIGSASSWARLFFFAGSLRCPDRGGRRAICPLVFLLSWSYLIQVNLHNQHHSLNDEGLSQGEVRVWSRMTKGLQKEHP